MLLLDGTAISSPTDLVAHVSCAHRTWLDLLAAHNLVDRTTPLDEAAVVLRRGDEHEQRVLTQLEAVYGPALELPQPQPGHGAALAAAQRATEDACRSGAPLIYQSTFFDATGLRTGRADFLIKVGTPSGLGGWSYEVVDAKLAAVSTVAAVLQCWEYSTHLTTLQGVPPQHLHVATPTGTYTSKLEDVAAYGEEMRRMYLDELELLTARLADLDGNSRALVSAADDIVGYPLPKQACPTCPHRDRCSNRRRTENHVSLIAGITARQTHQLEQLDVRTVEDAAVHPDVPAAVRHQARAQLHSTNGAPHVELRDCPGGSGLARLPEPDPHDLFFDFEGNPFVPGGGLEYLAGVYEHGAGFTALWAHDRPGEARMLEELLDMFDRHLEAHPGAHIYHYAPYEISALTRLCDRHSLGHSILARLTSRSAFVDLYRVVAEGLIVGAESYSIKYLEPCYGLDRSAQVQTSVGSVVAYEAYLREPDPERKAAILDEIERYNEDDCVSTHLLRDWLEALRSANHIERGEPLGDTQLDEIDARTERSMQRRNELAELADELRGRNNAGDVVLAGLVSWFNKESSTAWREYFERVAATPRERTESSTCIEGLTFAELDADGFEVYSYPAQDHKLNVRAGAVSWVDPHTQAPPGTIRAVDRDRCRVTIARNGERPRPSALIQGGPPKADVIEQRLLEFARDHLNCIDDTSPATNLLTRSAPDGVRDIDPSDAASLSELVAAAPGGVFAVQGPPGTGKTYLGSKLITDLVERGLTVAVCGPNHRAIDNVFLAACHEAHNKGTELYAVRRCSKENIETYDGASHGSVEVLATASNSVFANALLGRARAVPWIANLAAGTAWALCGNDLHSKGVRFDVVVIDEAGQFPLAQAMAVATTADRLVLLGDPAQLPQVEVASHGDIQAVSALGHFAGDATVIEPDQGVFLAHTHRMSAPLCAQVSDLAYQGKLLPAPSCEERHLNHPRRGRLDGVYRVAVPHTTPRTATSPEEVSAVAELVGELVGCVYHDPGRGTATPVTADDIVVIAPYNAHVAALADQLETRYPGMGDRVGTVDRFQGVEAAAAIFSLGASTPSDSRGAAFLFSTQRLNVALSRARAAAFIVHDPRVGRVPLNDLDDVAAASKFLRLLGNSEMWRPRST